MNILLTGQPKSGKTTLLRHVIADVADKEGFYTSEVRNGERRTGFQVEASDGSVVLLADVGHVSEHQVGRFYVDVAEFDRFIATRLSTPSSAPNTLVYLDEIGQMQLMSSRFQPLVESILAYTGLVVGTISAVFENDFITSTRTRADVILCEVTLENRESVERAVAAAVNHRDAFLKLSLPQQHVATQLARHYAQHVQWTSFYKLFNNAMDYVLENAVEVASSKQALVRGRHSSHPLTTVDNQWVCDCPLFTGRAPFEGAPAECSHVQAVKLFLVDVLPVIS